MSRIVNYSLYNFKDAEQYLRMIGGYIFSPLRGLIQDMAKYTSYQCTTVYETETQENSYDKNESERKSHCKTETEK